MSLVDIGLRKQCSHMGGNTLALYETHERQFISVPNNNIISNIKRRCEELKLT